MLIVWDEAKRRQNLAKHGLDFASFERGFAFDTVAVAAAKPGPSGVVRYKSIGRLDERTVVAAIVAPPGDRSPISDQLASVPAEPRGTSVPGRDRSLPPLTDEEEAEIQAGIEADPEWTEADFRNARPFAEAFPDLAAKLARVRAGQPPSAQRTVSLRIDQDVLDRFKAGGPDWEARMSEALRRASQDLPPAA